MLQDLKNRFDKKEQLKDQWLQFLSCNLEFLHDCFLENFRAWIKSNENYCRIIMTGCIENSENKILAKEILECFIKPKKLASRVIMIIESIYEMKITNQTRFVLPPEKRKLITGIKKFSEREYDYGELIVVSAVRPLIQYFFQLTIIDEKSKKTDADKFQVVMVAFVRRKCFENNVDLQKIRKQWIKDGNVDIFDVDSIAWMGKLIIVAFTFVILSVTYVIFYLTIGQ